MPNKTSDFAQKIESGETVGITFYYYSKENNLFLSALLKKIMERKNLLYLHDTVVTILRELIVNAVKANSKRLYFTKNNWDITNPEQYQNGISNFKEYIVKAGESISSVLRENGLKVEIFLKNTDSGFKIFVRNNTPILPNELQRIKTRIESAKKYKDFAEVYGDISDSTEGEGLGLTLSILFLRNSGIGEHSLQFGTDGKVTQTTLTIPRVLQPKAITSEIQNKIIGEIDSLPALPENINVLQKLCADSTAHMKDISDKVMLDPSLSASVLKLANSASFISKSKANTIQEAITTIGIKNLTALLSVTSAKSEMDKKFKSFKAIWDHCNKVAFYARSMTEMKRLNKITDKVFLSGMLHDLGKIVLLSASPSLNEWLSDFAMRREIRTSTILEELSIGISHTTIGEQISKKWNMPDYVTDAIKYHHSPVLYNGENKQIVSVVYFANELCNTTDPASMYQKIESDVLTMFGFENESSLLSLYEDLKALPFESIL